ncbi:MAG: hypothetical protein LBE80_09135 [Deltaproteobacteria bacterium]|nr:hypothetical protein [Deltaproteobacteria bacterium]
MALKKSIKPDPKNLMRKTGRAVLSENFLAKGLCWPLILMVMNRLWIKIAKNIWVESLTKKETYILMTNGVFFRFTIGDGYTQGVHF